MTTIAKYITVLAIATVPSNISMNTFDTLDNKANVSEDKAYVLGFEDGSEAVSNAVNAQMCASHYKKAGKAPGPECYAFFENFQLRMLRYERIKSNLEKAGKKDGKDSRKNKKNSGK